MIGPRVRQTSIDVYRKIQAEGLLSAWKLKIYNAIFEHGPITQGECWQEHFPERQRHDVGPRFAELKALGVIEEVGKVQCRVTGRSCYQWDVTGTTPIGEAPNPEPTYKNKFIVREFYDYMREINVPYAYQEDLRNWIETRLAADALTD